MTEDTRDSRTSRRVNVHYRAFFKTSSETLEGTISNISEGGVLFSSVKPLVIHSPGVFVLKVFSNEPEAMLKGEIIYRLTQKEGSGAREYGARFIESDSGQKELIARILRFSAVKERFLRRAASFERD